MLCQNTCVKYRDLFLISFFSLLFYCLLVFLTLIFCNSSPFLHIEVTMPKAILYVLLVSLFIKALSVSASVIYIYMIHQTSS